MKISGLLIFGLFFEWRRISFAPIIMKILAYLGLLSLALFTSCAEEDTTDPFVDPREKFIGKWKCTETSGTVTTFDIYITSYGESDSIRISNFANYLNSAVALGLVDGNSVTIPNQNIGVTNIEVEGNGTYTNQGGNEKINLVYIHDGNNATAVCVRTN